MVIVLLLVQSNSITWSASSESFHDYSDYRAVHVLVFGNPGNSFSGFWGNSYIHYTILLLSLNCLLPPRGILFLYYTHFNHTRQALSCIFCQYKTRTGSPSPVLCPMSLRRLRLFCRKQKGPAYECRTLYRFY